MSGNPWFRLYSEFSDDSKVQMMSEAMQRRLIMLMCSKCKGETLHETELAFHWRISETEMAETKAVFMKKGFIDEDWNLLNWSKRQFLSDSSTQRVRRFRQGKKQDETLHETDDVVTVTPPEQIQNITDTDSEQTKTLAQGASAPHASSPPPEPFVGTIPLVDGSQFGFTQSDVSAWSEAYPAVNVPVELRQMREWCKANPKNRKTGKGIRRFITGWLATEQDKGGSGSSPPARGKPHEPGIYRGEKTDDAWVNEWRVKQGLAPLEVQ